MQIDSTRFKQFLKKSSYKSICELARKSGLHRNTINHYLSGGKIYQKGFLKICQELNISPDTLLVLKKQRPLLSKKVAMVIDKLHQVNPKITFVLFGSRAKGTYLPYSDWDIGFISTSTEITHQNHLDLLKLVDDLTEDFIDKIDLVNLNEADADFLNKNKNEFIFLTGQIAEFYQFLERIKDYER